MSREDCRRAPAGLVACLLLLVTGAARAAHADAGAGAGADTAGVTADVAADVDTAAAVPLAAGARQPNPPWTLTEKRVRLDRADVNVVRSGPGETFAVVRLVPRGESFPVIAKKDAWYDVRLSDTTTGWVHESLCHAYDDLSGLEFRPNPRMFSRIGSFTLTGYAGGYSFDRKSNSLTLGGRFGYYVLDFVEVEGGVGWTHVNRPAEIVESLFNLSLEAEKFHMLFYEMNANVKLLPGRQLVPYATAGVGSTIMRGQTEAAFNYGGGIDFFVARTTALRWEFRTYRFKSGSDAARRMNNNYSFTVGTTLLL
jgi:outer membrane beta-barrel protein